MDLSHIRAASTSSINDFDFLVGKWNIRNKKLKTRLAHSDDWTEFNATHEMNKILAGAGNLETIRAHVDGAYYEGMGIRLFDRTTALWRIYWTDNNSGRMEPPVIGSFSNTLGIFFCGDVFNGQEILVQFQWDISNPDQPVWKQGFSTDQGLTWEWNWYMYFTRQDH